MTLWSTYWSARGTRTLSSPIRSNCRQAIVPVASCNSVWSILSPTSSPGSSDPSTMWSSRILVTRFFAIVHHPRLAFPNSSTHSTFSSSVVCPRTSRCIRSGAALARSWDSVPVDPAWCRTPEKDVSDALRYWWRTIGDVTLRVFRSRGVPHPEQCVTCSVKVSLVLSSSKNTHLYSRPTHQNSPQRSAPRAHGHTKLAIGPPPSQTCASIVTYTTKPVPAFGAHSGKNGPKYVAGSHLKDGPSR